MKPLKIALSGAQCTGKTTLLNALKEDEFFKDFRFVPSFSTLIAKESGHSENTNLNTQLRMLYESVKQLNECDDNTPTVLDRCVLDVLIYTTLYDENAVQNIFLDIFSKYYKKIDFIFILGTENIPFDDSKETRSCSKEYRERVNKIFRKVDLENVVQVPGSLTTQGRIEFFKNRIKSL